MLVNNWIWRKLSRIFRIRFLKLFIFTFFWLGEAMLRLTSYFNRVVRDDGGREDEVGIVLNITYLPS